MAATTTTEEETAWWDYEPTCDGKEWVDDWLVAVRDILCQCLEDCGIPAPDTKCIGVCPPVNDDNLAANGCCNRIDVWPGQSVIRFQRGACDIPIPTLVVNFRLLRCKVNWEACSDEHAEKIRKALNREVAVITECVPMKLCEHTCCDGGLETQNVVINRVCSPCVGIEGSFQLSRAGL